MVKRKTLRGFTAIGMVSALIAGIVGLSVIGMSQVYIGTNPLYYLASDLYEGYSTSYGFTVKNETLNVWIQPNGGVILDYNITFENTYYQPIDIVDVGLPNIYYNLLSIQAFIDGTPIPNTCIRPSTLIWVGPEIDLRAAGTSFMILDGQTRTLRVIAECPIMVFKDDITPFTMASMSIMPTYFDEDY